jgi:hypothetical protein
MKRKIEWQVRSSEDAQRKARALKSIWSNESFLTLGAIIYLARLMEENNRLLGGKPQPRRWWQFWK